MKIAKNVKNRVRITITLKVISLKKTWKNVRDTMFRTKHHHFRNYFLQKTLFK